MRGSKFSQTRGPGQQKNKCPPLWEKTLICRHSSVTFALETLYFGKLNGAIARWKANLQSTGPLMIISRSLNKNPMHYLSVSRFAKASY